MQGAGDGGRHKAKLACEEAIRLFLVGGGKFAELRDRGTPLYGLTNWSAETYPPAVERGGYFLLRGVAAKAEADGGAGFFRV